MSSNETKNILEEQKFPYENMSLEERNYYLRVIRNCKEICDTKNKVDNISSCEILEMRLNKKEEMIFFQGSLAVGTDQNREYRLINGEIYIEENSIKLEYQITRLGNINGRKNYYVLDEFKLEDSILKRISCYSIDDKHISEISDETMKGKLK